MRRRRINARERFLWDNAVEHTYSPEFQARLAALLHREAEIRRSAVRRRVLVCALAGLLVSCTAVRPAYEYMANAVLRHTEKYVQIRFYPDEDGEEVPCTLHYVPEGYTLTYSYDSAVRYDLEYEDEDGLYLSFTRDLIRANLTPSNLDNEHHTFKTIKIGEHEVIFAGTDEVITFKHTAYSKAIFGKGAVQAGKFLAGKKPGYYDMQDVIAAQK